MSKKRERAEQNTSKSGIIAALKTINLGWIDEINASLKNNKYPNVSYPDSIEADFKKLSISEKLEVFGSSEAKEKLSSDNIHKDVKFTINKMAYNHIKGDIAETKLTDMLKLSNDKYFIQETTNKFDNLKDDIEKATLEKFNSSTPDQKTEFLSDPNFKNSKHTFSKDFEKNIYESLAKDYVRANSTHPNDRELQDEQLIKNVNKLYKTEKHKLYQAMHSIGNDKSLNKTFIDKSIKILEPKKLRIMDKVGVAVEKTINSSSKGINNIVKKLTTRLKSKKISQSTSENTEVERPNRPAPRLPKNSGRSPR